MVVWIVIAGLGVGLGVYVRVVSRSDGRINVAHVIGFWLIGGGATALLALPLLGAVGNSGAESDAASFLVKTLGGRADSVRFIQNQVDFVDHSGRSCTTRWATGESLTVFQRDLAVNPPVCSASRRVSV